jgi:uncharacterized protein (DUF934 family)
MALLRNGRIENDDWRRVGTDDPPGEGDIVVPLARWRAEREQLECREGRVGVLIAPDEDIEDLGPDLAALPLLAVDFPVYTDGRGYSTARLARERFGFTGELRAVGDVLPDQVRAMRRCGFDAMELKEGRDPEVALRCLEEISVRLQSVGDETPLRG